MDVDVTSSRSSKGASRMAETCEVLVAVSESDMSHTVFFPCYDEGTQACAYHEGCGTKLELESNGVFELPVEIVLHKSSDDWKERQFRFELITFGAGTDRGHVDHDRKLPVHEVLEACKTVSVSPAGKVQAWSLVVGGNLGSRAVFLPIPTVGLLEERPAISGRREKTQREELQCQVEDDTAEGLVEKTVTNKIFSSLDRCDDHVTAGLCPFRVIDRW